MIQKISYKVKEPRFGEEHIYVSTEDDVLRTNRRALESCAAYPPFVLIDLLAPISISLCSLGSGSKSQQQWGPSSFSFQSVLVIWGMVAVNKRMKDRRVRTSQDICSCDWLLSLTKFTFTVFPLLHQVNSSHCYSPQNCLMSIPFKTVKPCK